MRPTRTFAAMVVLLGAAWGVGLAFAGLHLLGIGLAEGLSSAGGAVAALLGLACLTAGNFVVMTLVADRLFRRASAPAPDPRTLAEAAAAVLLALLIVLTLIVWRIAATP